MPKDIVVDSARLSVAKGNETMDLGSIVRTKHISAFERNIIMSRADCEMIWT